MDVEEPQPVQVHLYATRTPTGAGWLTEVSIIPDSAVPRAWAGEHDRAHTPAGELHYTAVLADLPMQRPDIDRIAGQVDVHVFHLEQVWAHDGGGEHLRYIGWRMPPFP